MRRVFKYMISMIRGICIGIATLGMLLFATDIVGIAVIATNPRVQGFERFAEEPIADRESFVRRLVRFTDEGIYHVPSDINRPLLWDNWLLYVLSYTDPVKYEHYEYIDSRKAIARGTGFCSQSALVITDVLQKRGIPSKMVALNGHVVASAEVYPDQWWILDGDYDVVIPHSIEEIEQDPEIIREYVEPTAGPLQTDVLIDIYGPEGNGISADGWAYHGRTREEVNKQYTLKWAIPLVMMVASVVVWRLSFLSIESPRRMFKTPFNNRRKGIDLSRID